MNSQSGKEDGAPSHSRDKRPFRPGQRRGDYLSTVTCYKCGKQGHVASRCPEKAMYCVNGVVATLHFREWDWWKEER